MKEHMVANPIQAMLLPAPGKIWPLEAFDYPENHKSRKGGNPRIIGMMLNAYMAGHPLKPSVEEIVEWVKTPETISTRQRAALHEFGDSWAFFDLWSFHFNSGCTLYEIANAMRIAGAMAPLPVHYINSLARGYVESGEGPDDRACLVRNARRGIGCNTIWRGFTIAGDRL